MKEDFDRLQKQLQTRKEKEQTVQDNLRYAIEEKIHKVNLLNKRNE